MIKVLFVCHGNICRSPMAQSILTHLAARDGLAHQLHINSAATSREEIGNPPHYGTVSKLNQVGIPVIPHRAVQMTAEDYDNYDYLIGMDDANIRSMKRICDGRSEKIHKILEFSNSNASVADPWYTGNFNQTYEDLMRGCKAFLNFLKENKEL